MPYYFSHHDGSPIEIAGYYYVQPFSFRNSLLQRNPRSARLAVTVALTGHDDDSYPSVTQGLATTGDITIADEVEGAILNASGFKATAVSSSQSRDLALTTWIFQGSNDSSIGFTPASINDEPNPGRVHAEERVRWYGHADTEGPGPNRLNLSYLAAQISYGQTHDLTAMDLIGIANMRGSGSLVAWLLGQALNQMLATVTVSDVSRGTISSIAGNDPDASRQMASALGAAYVFNGVFKELPAAELAAFSRRFNDQSASVVRDAAHEGSGIFVDMTQRVLDTPDGTRKNPNSYAINGPDFEGLSFWGLEPRGTTDAALLY
ncbi:hypothetical protein FHT77_005861 [Rhizobium sp. BK181]|uniref:hypothetical protein n=1 Tax=Rhizobium sp. BK181 TaxID=2587072 RepID=UPI001617129A|nr:hypothetical protein [Rhizobium sp. BK181]MBB3319943.1 hypothetical protein [Rhizobium sp. BK181]